MKRIRKIDLIIKELGFEILQKEYMSIPLINFCEKYKICGVGLKAIFGAKPSNKGKKYNKRCKIITPQKIYIDTPAVPIINYQYYSTDGFEIIKGICPIKYEKKQYLTKRGEG